jgi:hypothetical protein
MRSPSTHKDHLLANHQDNLRKMKQLNQDIAMKVEIVSSYYDC